MGKIKRKNASGTAKTYMTRNQALKRLQISLADFRRLCILKGVYPHDPKYKKKITGNSSSSLTTFYHAKDIKHLMHEPILEKFRQYKAYSKKLAKLVGKREWFLVKRFEQNKPTYSLDHVIKERYPSFQVALKDLDDSLCHLFVFASLPSINGFTEKLSKECRHLVQAFQHYVMETHGLRKAFLSVKGIYFQASVKGETVTWLMPYEFSQYVPPNVDFRVMLTFLEFYQSLIGFVNFKLYAEKKLVYPPVIDEKAEEEGLGLMSMKLEYLDGEKPSEDSLLSEDATQLEGLHEAQSLMHKEQELQVCKSLFANMVFFISREVPKDVFVFVIQSFGGRVGWGHCTSPIKENDPSITHHIVDRPVVENMFMNRKYVQPQWVIDSINEKKVLNEALYGPGVKLPAHMSPFVEDEESEHKEEDAMVEDQQNIAQAEKEYIRKLRQDNQGNVEVEERKELALSMLSKKKRKLYEAMQRSNKKKSDEKDRLATKRRNIAAKKAAAN